MAFLENWASLDIDHSVSLLGAIEALKASTLRLPVVGALVCPFTHSQIPSRQLSSTQHPLNTFMTELEHIALFLIV